MPNWTERPCPESAFPSPRPAQMAAPRRNPIKYRSRRPSPVADRRRAGRLVVPRENAPADKMLLERSAIEELSHHADPWRVLRILSEFVEGFDALNEVGPAVTVFGSARAKHSDLYYKAGIALG